MFACGKTKPNKEKEKKPEKFKDIPLCSIHNNPYESICLAGECNQNQIQSSYSIDQPHMSKRLCASCIPNHQHCEKIQLKELEQLLQSQKGFELVNKIKKQLSKEVDWDKSWRESFNRSFQRLKDIIQHFQEMILTTFFMIKEIPQLFNATDVNLLLNHSIIQNFEDLTNQVKQIKDVDDDTLYLLGKLLHHEQASNELLNSIEPDFNQVKKRLQVVQSEIDSNITFFEKSLSQINAKHQQKQEEKSDPLFDFISEAKSLTQQQFNEQLGQISKISKKKQFDQIGQSDEQVQVKSIIQINELLLAYCTNLNKVHLLQLPDLEVIESLDLEEDIMVMGKGVAKNDKNEEIMQLIIGVESSDSYLIQFWNLQPLQLLGQELAHSKYIWNIIQLPNQKIATCSEDSYFKIFDVKERKELKQIQVHQACVNDIAIVSADLIASVSDDQLCVLTNFESGELNGMMQDTSEIKTVCNLDGASFATGNQHGFVKVYSVQKMELLIQIKAHQSLIRNLVRVNPKIVATTSWDGTHAFLQTDNGAIIKKIDGPIKNFSEAIQWNQNFRMLIAGQGGKIVLYK